MFKLICFDLDKTLTKQISWHELTTKLGGDLKKHLDLYQKMKRNELSFEIVKKEVIKMYQKTGKATKNNINNILQNIDLHDDAINLINYFKSQNFKIYIISGALESYVQYFSKILNVDGYYSNGDFVYDNNNEITDLNFDPDEKSRKVTQLRQLMAQLQIKLVQVVYIGDGDNDIEVFKIVKGIAVHSKSKELIKLAWKSTNSLSDIKNII